jgi:23S rRNA (pseudouridine1915-N3)-methyltransferase
MQPWPWNTVLPSGTVETRALDIHIITAGRLDKAAPERILFEDYAARFAGMAPRLGFAPLRLHEARGKSPAEELKAIEAAIPANAHRIALDPGGKAFTSEAFAAHLARLRDRGAKTVGFLIGGAEGLGPLCESAPDRMSLGLQTWPHRLVRVMLAEQLYRAASILAGHPYHRG